MNSELKGAIIIVLTIATLILISFVGGFVVCTLVIFDVIKAPLIVKILSYIASVLISVSFGAFISYDTDGGKKDDSAR